jgi:hypothetical protein
MLHFPFQSTRTKNATTPDAIVSVTTIKETNEKWFPSELPDFQLSSLSLPILRLLLVAEVAGISFLDLEYKATR